MAVGSYNNGGTYVGFADQWNGTLWGNGTTTTDMAPPGGGIYNTYLTGVSCQDNTFCAAVGYYTVVSANSDLFDVWNSPGGWSSVTTPVDGSSSVMNSVYCQDSTNCWATANVGGTAVNLERYDGTQITNVAPPAVTSPSLAGISCWAEDTCYAVGYSGSSPSQTLAFEIAGGDQDNYLNSVSCVGTTMCMAVGYYYNTNSGIDQTVAQEWTSSTGWGLMDTPNLGAMSNELMGVTCTSATACVAVGFVVQGAVINTLAMDWTAAGGWATPTVAYTPALGSKSNLFNSISCDTTAPTPVCWAVGAETSASAFSVLVEQCTLTAGVCSSWAAPTTPFNPGSNGNELYGVSCLNQATVVCTAVGDSTNASSIYQALVLQVVGTTWANQSTSSNDTSPTNNNRLQAVSCYNDHGCVAVGDATYPSNPSYTQNLVEQYVPNAGSACPCAWSIVSTSTAGTFQQVTTDTEILHGVSCLSATFCAAVGQEIGASYSLVSVIGGTGGWQVVPPQIPGDLNTTISLLGVSCYVSGTANDCIAAGQYNDNPNNDSLVEIYTGGSGGGTTGPGSLTGVSGTGSGAGGSGNSTVSVAIGNFKNTGGYSQIMTTNWTQGTGWSTTVTTCSGCSASTSYFVNSISCIGNGNSSDFCMAVGYSCPDIQNVCASENSSGTPIAFLCTSSCGNGGVFTSTSPAPPTAGTNGYLEGVSCVTATFCIAVGKYNSGNVNLNSTLVDKWGVDSGPCSGACQWVSTPLASYSYLPGSQDNVLHGVSCFATSFCKAVGEATTGATGTIALAEGMNTGPDSFVADTPYFVPSDSNHLTAVTCAATTFCMATGYYCSTGVNCNAGSTGYQTLAEDCTPSCPSGVTWNNTSPGNASANDKFLAVDCTSPNNCKGAGNYTDASGNQYVLIETWAGGQWHVNGSDKCGTKSNGKGISAGSNNGNGVAVGSCTSGGTNQPFAEVGTSSGGSGSGGGVVLVA